MYMNMNWDILIRSFKGDISVEEEAVLNRWLAESSTNRQLADELRQQQQTIDTLTNADEQGEQWQLLQQRLATVPVKQLAWPRLAKWASVAAAVITIFFFSKFIMDQSKEVVQPDHMVKVVSTDKQKRKMVLPDGSTVWLHYNSTLMFDSVLFNTKDRTVQLVGEAFFDVAKNKQKPFIIKTEAMAVNVVGTSFNVSARSNETQEVKVATGIVKVTGSNMNEQLYAGNALSYNMLTKQATRSEVNVKEAIALKDNNLVFEKDNLVSIANKLQHWYNRKVTIATKENVQKPVSFTGIVPDDGMETVLKGLSYISGFTYKITDSEIIIYPQH